MRRVLIVLLGAAILVPALALGGTLFASEERAEVIRVVDGDTIVVRISGKDEKVRLIGVDTPESVHPNQPVEHFDAVPLIGSEG